ncbi:conserved hypothetical protein [Afipia carboxidovorans OM5]|uniref:DUF3551 domain-containing protein n=1 Tax=Afipia carboxidovorans (strain ATCC 49405 / DSM 1227 / KCTC 32145 / OM5) TaxID=504832 RepID=B6JG01_AFIC5|nr:DUF3551 domain-containing protein [Afipia carboxidovorans]ACI93733.1 conserved hypothetical protein [Afipia carboxidovorans OM5]AEI02585.1 hypothetical protein OCA4_c14450 [Afipia carboxidovorans OM4]AEI06161.1 hypothetical protein OCA5_c14450 [Afipia carboxidovorans OM5]BEV46953.1 hypothetical protein CRBSH125_31360 [Afipia carboxidovorans]
MRILITGLMAAATLGVMLAAPTPAEAFERRICLIGGGYPYPGDCAYDTFAQCKASAAGQQAYCDVNPAYAFAEAEGRRIHPRDGFDTTRFIFGGYRFR